MSVIETKLELAQRHARTLEARSEIQVQLDQADNQLTALASQQQQINEMLEQSQKTIQDSRALLQEIDEFNQPWLAISCEKPG